MNRGLLTLAGAFGFSAVALGAFGAHGLRDRLRRPRLVAGLFCAGITIFSGTLYLLAITGASWLGAVTPIGGVLLLAGWAAVLAEGFRRST